MIDEADEGGLFEYVPMIQPQMMNHLSEFKKFLTTTVHKLKLLNFMLAIYKFFVVGIRCTA